MTCERLWYFLIAKFLIQFIITQLHSCVDNHVIILIMHMWFFPFFFKMSKKDLLALDFEGILKYFRVTLPKKYRSEKNARDLLAAAINIKVHGFF